MKTVLVILLGVLMLLQVRLWTGPGSIADIARLEDAIEAQNQENANLTARNSVLMEEVSDLRNGLDSIEERARNELGLIRQGETFYLMVDEEPAADNATSSLSRGGERPPELPTENVVSESPPEIVEDDNPYLEIFRDEENAAATAAEPTAGQ